MKAKRHITSKQKFIPVSITITFESLSELQRTWVMVNDRMPDQKQLLVLLNDLIQENQ